MIRPFGEHALLVELDGWARAQVLASGLNTKPIEGVEAAVPGLASVLVELEPAAAVRSDQIAAELSRRLDRLQTAPIRGRTRVIPVIYGGEHGPDLADVAARCGLTADEYAARHAAAELRVQLCGFAPGFAYLGDLPESLRVPRLATPRTSTPAGSVAVAGAMTGIYPADLPGGWRVIGRTPLLLFDPRRDPPTYLAPGDTVRWRPIDAASSSGTTTPADDW